MINKTKQLNLTFIDNESHGYLKVSKETFFQLELNGSEFSEYSYYYNNNFYLEEDCDATKFINIAKNKGYKINFLDKFVNYKYFDNPKYTRINN